MKKFGDLLFAAVIVVAGTITVYFITEENSRAMNVKAMDDLVNPQLAKWEKELPIPPVLKDQNPDPNKAEFHLKAQKGKKEFFPGMEADTLGFNGDYLGPLIRVKTGEQVQMKVENQIGEETTVHWHGLEIDGEDDGGPHTVIDNGTVWAPEFTINQPAGTMWYHPHLLDETGRQVYKGLAGLFYIDDENSKSLDIPKKYGVDDIPLIVQDRTFTEDGNITYNLNMPDVMMGLHGDTVTVNGAINPYKEVPRGKVRFRLLNGSNARIYDFQLDNGESFHQIASDGGLLEKPVEMDSLTLSPGERAEIIVDFSDYKKGETVQLTDSGTPFIEFRVDNKKGNDSPLPDKLADIPEPDRSSAKRTREIAMQGMGPMVNINGKQMDINRIDEVLKLHEPEIWGITNPKMRMMGNEGGLAHPFHVHGVQFQVLSRDGNQPPQNERGWKDTVLVYPGEEVEVLATWDYKGIFMYHCHILEHEDAGMMGQIKVEE
ncbi:multicopper oxidase family protein [Bacillus marinisedimentorum]|uniref:multicopper oxidase family protein n=1 Tax=Bacillus marinisedimentorum TaxID=1821260 RepID=UPI0008721AFF|nr:multicopper oxidase domain-containing protein [Bacillus marinisedimentorum]